ncbi:MAG: hypothetical protein KDD11_23125, partial [Acidobacteria bacterium]|nr:hypothetical protein [Acidobacteriota bacterium]
HRRPSTAWLLFVALFMISLAGFYEPLLSRVGLARWEEGTRTTFGVPWIALVGYPTLAVTFLLLWSAVLGRWQRAGHRVLALALTLTPLALAHAEGLHRLKHLLGW